MNLWRRCAHFAQLMPFEHDRRELDGEHRQVGHHADADLEQHRSVVPVDHHVPDALGMTQVNQQSDGHHDVAEEGGQHGRTKQGLKFLDAQDVHRAGHEEAAAADGHAGEQVEADPEAPGVGVAQVADGANAGGVADHGNHKGHAPSGSAASRPAGSGGSCRGGGVLRYCSFMIRPPGSAGSYSLLLPSSCCSRPTPAATPVRTAPQPRAKGMVIAMTFSLTWLTGVSGSSGRPSSANGTCERIR